jgi:hypothetical protein
MGKRTGKPRGAPRGNRNRLVHGRYSAATKLRRAALRALLAECTMAIADQRSGTAGTVPSGAPSGRALGGSTLLIPR